MCIRDSRSGIVNKQIRVGDSKNVIVFDPLLTGHVIRRTNVAENGRNATICSTFEVQYGKSMSMRTTAIRHLGHLQHITGFRACTETHTSFNRGP